MVPGSPIGIPSMTEPTPQIPQAPHLQNPIDHVIARLGIHPNSGLAQAFRAIHAALTAHLESQAAQVAHATHGMQGVPFGMHPTAQVGRGIHEPRQLFFNSTHHPMPVAPVRPGPILQ